MTCFTIIAAMTPTGLIGKGDHDLPWDYGADLKMFAELTKDAGAVIMGRNTFDGLMDVLDDRQNFVMTHSPLPDGYIMPPNLTLCYSLAECLERVKAYKPFGRSLDDVYVIGGKAIFEAFMLNHYVDYMTITEVPSLLVDGDKFFPDFTVRTHRDGYETWDKPSSVWHIDYASGDQWDLIHTDISKRGHIVHTYKRVGVTPEEE